MDAFYLNREEALSLGMRDSHVVIGPGGFKMRAHQDGIGEYCMTSVHRLGLLSLSVLLACGDEPQKIEPF